MQILKHGNPLFMGPVCSKRLGFHNLATPVDIHPLIMSKKNRGGKRKETAPADHAIPLILAHNRARIREHFLQGRNTRP